MTLLPSRLIIPARTAEVIDFRSDGSTFTMTARDISWALGIAYLAAREGKERKHGDPKNDMYRLPDNGLRSAIGVTRRKSIEEEYERWYRIRNANDVYVPSRWTTVPSLFFRRRPNGEEHPERFSLDGFTNYVVRDEVVDAFTIDDDEPVVALPLQLLQNARCNRTVLFVLRMLAWMHYGIPQGNILTLTSDLIAVRLEVADVIRYFSIPKGTNPTHVVRDYLEPVVKDAFKAAGIVVEVTPRLTRTHSNPKGRIRDLILSLCIPEETEHERRIREMREKRPDRRRRKGWRQPPRSHKPKKERPAPPASPKNVEILHDPEGEALQRMIDLAKSGKLFPPGMGGQKR